jgi:hypothetical protein
LNFQVMDLLWLDRSFSSVCSGPRKKRISTRGLDRWLFSLQKWKFRLVGPLSLTPRTPYQRYATCNPAKNFTFLFSLCTKCCWRFVCWILCRTIDVSQDPLGKPQEEGMMSTTVSFPSVWNQSLIDQ